MMHLLEKFGRYEDAEIEALGILERIRLSGYASKSVKMKNKFLPEVDKGGGDKDFCRLVVENVVVLVKCAAMGQNQEGVHFSRVLDLVEEVRPWFRVLDVCTHEKLHRTFVIYLGECALTLVEKATSYDMDLLKTFCCMTLTEYVKSSLKDQVYKIAHSICSSLFKLQENRSLYIIDILDYVARECKVEEETGTEYVELVSYCVNKCQIANAAFCSMFAAHLNKAAEHYQQVTTPISMIMRLYASGLLLISCNARFEDGDLASSGGAKFHYLVGTLLDNDNIVHTLSTLKGPLHSDLHICSKMNSMSSSVKEKDFASQICKQLGSMTYLPYYLNALEFFCRPLAKSINSEMKQLVAEKDGASAMTILSAVLDAFHLLCHLILSCSRITPERDGNGLDENCITVLNVAAAAFTLSIKIKLDIQKSVQLIKQIVAKEWITIEGRNYIIAGLYNIGLVLYRNKETKEASKVLSLCCKTSWVNIKCHRGDQLGDEFVELVNEACTKSALFLDILDEVDNHKVRKKVSYILKNWCAANDLFERLPAPMPVVKQWVKMECKRVKQVNETDSSLTLYCLLSSSTEISKRNIGIILKQELNAYEEMSFSYPEFCQQMQMKIIAILLQDVYVNPESSFEKALTLVRKGKALRVCGKESLKDCIQCFSEAITMIKEISRGTYTNMDYLNHQLSVAYSLRALCTLEAEPSSKQIFEDVKAALNLWLSFYIPDCDKGECSALSDNIMILLYNIVDISQLKGFMELHNDVYRLVIRIFELKNVSVEKWLTLLWESRRLNHALCISPVNEEFILNSSSHLYGLSSVDFWIRYLKGSQPLMIGFQQNFLFLFADFYTSSCDHRNSFQTDIKVDDVKKTALELIANVPVSRHSYFLAGCLYYDLCPRLISSGQLIDALSFAKEAQRLHAKLFEGKFLFRPEVQTNGLECSIENLGVNKSVAREVFLFDSISWDLNDCYLSPWKIMQCYLESTLQVGIIHEMIGNGAETEASLKWGKAISSKLKLPLFMVAFSLILGKLYRKKRLWDLAEKELQSSEHILKDSSTSFCCSKCKLMLEVTLYQYLGDLSQTRIDSSADNISVVTAENWYKSALDKLNLSEWKNPVSCPQDNSDESARHAQFDACFTTYEENVNMKSMREGSETKNRAKCLPEEQTLAVESNSRLTRSRYRSSQNPSKSKVGDIKSLEGNRLSVSDQSDKLSQEVLTLKKAGCTVSSSCAVNCNYNKRRCWHCIPYEVMKSGQLLHFINLKWEFVRRQLSMKLLTQLGNCFAYPAQTDEAQNILLRRISVLVSRNPFYQKIVPVALDYFCLLVAKENPGDVFAIERAEILHDICWFSLKNYHSKHIRNIFCNLSFIKFDDLASWLMLAFVLSRQVPALFQKVSRLLAVMYIVSASREQFSLSTLCKVFGENYWASYFLQASIGIHFTYQFFSNQSGRGKVVHPAVEATGLSVTGSSYIREGTCDLLRLAPQSTLDLEENLKKFLIGLPSATVVCISLLGSDYTSLLQELLLPSTCIYAWMLVSRFGSKSEPVVMLLPVESISQDDYEDDDTKSCLGSLFESENSRKHWRCPWGSSFTVVDDLAPAFKMILEEGFLSEKGPLENTENNWKLLWNWRKKLDLRLQKLLSNIENSWFGSWKCMLLGELSNCKNLDSVHKKLVHDLRSKCKLDVNEALLKVILGGFKYVDRDGDTWPCPLWLKKSCYIAKVGYRDEAMRGVLSNAANEIGLPSKLAFELLMEALRKLEVVQSREPIILVLDSDIQMLPWENFLIVRNQEVYRMPSVSSISALLNKISNHREQVERNSLSFPRIDPLDAFYLLNPCGNLIRSQSECENWFRSHNLEGKAGSKPTAEEWVAALKSHDLFIYLGHGSGAKYISKQEIQNLDNCAATVLMGCCSGSLTIHGEGYAPQGIALSYLLAGSPAVVANLWSVTENDITLFTKAMLEAWLKERSTEESEAIYLNGNGKAKRRKVSRKKTKECETDSPNNSDHRPKIGSFLCQARRACALPFLVGAAPVCYGIPTGIYRKKSL